MPNGQPRRDILPRSDAIDDYIDIAALYASVVPVLGGAISAVLNGWSRERQMQRVGQVLQEMADEITSLGAKVNDEYVKSDAFEDLLDQTLRRVASERYERKRGMYREVLVGAATSPTPSYDEQLRLVRAVEELQPDKVRVLAEMKASGDGTFPGLRHRLGGMPADALADAIDHLVTVGVVRLENGNARVTPFGHRFAAVAAVVQGAGNPQA